MTAHAVADRLASFGSTIFAEMTALAVEHQAINLGQGFPDFDGPPEAIEAAQRAMRDGHNQYGPLPGVPALREAIADRWRAGTGASIDPASEVTVTFGCTEAIAATMLGLINPGDEVVCFEPFYDSYRACIAMAGATGRFVPLRPREDCSGFDFDPDELRAAFSPRTKVVLVNTPHNPTGKVFTSDELELIAELALRHDAIVASDEVYERLTYDGTEHGRIATLDGMADRTLTLSSIGKSYSLTGWKVGWAIGAPMLINAVRSAMQFLTFSVGVPFQVGSAVALRECETYVTDLRAHYARSRDTLMAALEDVGLRPITPEGSYFIMANHTALSAPMGAADDVEFCRALIERAGVVAIPPSSFYTDPEGGRSLVRFGFCKKTETLDAAIERLGSLR